MYTFYQQQKNTAKKLIEFLTPIAAQVPNLVEFIPYCILLAQMQCGKTGTYLYLACKCIHDNNKIVSIRCNI